ncbi:hypothetical protein [Thermococcus peptonophilus]|uniref:Uncharacterized protein n=1 Tax=Thermococcus peptonophilus TaxID=53952 RepID=A0A142CV96_9EURY|nr:hypothetical protein [Thermococcus peptonophilus]AMQ18698.1 hypothetical protein A0127_05700 [Thermococcus peptonophilus]
MRWLRDRATKLSEFAMGLLAPEEMPLRTAHVRVRTGAAGPVRRGYMQRAVHEEMPDISRFVK